MSAAATPRPGPLPVTSHARSSYGLAALDSLAPEWCRMCRASDAAPFLYPDWIRAHVCAFEDPGRLMLVTVREDGALTGVLALLRERAWFRGCWIRRLRSAAGVHSLRFDVATAPAAPGRRAVAAIGALLRARRDWDVIELRDVPAGGAAENLVSDAAALGYPTGRWESMQTPYVDLGPSVVALPRTDAPPAALRGASADFRHHLRRTRRKIEASAEIKLRLVRATVATPSQRRQALADFYALEAAGWKGANGTAIAQSATVRSFYDQAAGALAARNALVLHRLERNGRPIAISFSILEGDCYYAIKWCYDEAFAVYGPGHLLTWAILDECVESRVRRFDFTGPDAGYKRKWTATRLPHAYLYIFRPRPLGRWLRMVKFVWTPYFQRWAQSIQCHIFPLRVDESTTVPTHN